eukprot:CAMPEP_0184859866 /NCGR_PEP_ID=MMETSP0580-20130426/4835_1 /TAXON_ID=1118495 /ORGANISM="Dactyliosolen fragilissimus" /LENGTH=543 /DNA_ID=CAMNT_0027356721 /DNA_START=206 /DNA_END=1837 /DNA_ORIENTATION=+
MQKEESEEFEIEFPPPLSKVDRLKRAAKFWSSALPIVGAYYSLSTEIYIRENVLGENLSTDDIEMLWSLQHQKGAEKLADTITSLKGFYVKTAQIIASRRDLFPMQYTEALSNFTDNVDPIPASLAKAVIEKELLHRDEKFEDVFVDFDETPLGAASIAQVHKATLTEKYGGPKEVAIKIQRPSIESKLMGDIANLKALAGSFRENDALPLDYYTVFAELEAQLQDEFDFVAEAVAMDRIYQTLSTTPDGLPCEPPLILPRPVPGLVSKRVLVMDYLEGVPLSRAREEMLKNGIDPDSPESKLFGRKLLKSLTEVFGRCILESGFFHADPHPGNIFVLKDGSIGLIDFGQVKQISGRARQTLAKVMIALDERQSDTNPDDLELIGNLALELGVELNEDAKDEAPAAVAMWLFDGSVETLPGGYDKGELSPNSPVKELKSFPQDLVLVGRSSILIKGLSNRLGIPWSLAKEWSTTARHCLEYKDSNDKGVIRFRDVLKVTKSWGKRRATGVVSKLPPSLRSKAASLILVMKERKERKRSSRNKT